MPVCFAPINGAVMHVMCVVVLLCLSSHSPFSENKTNVRLHTVLDLL